MFGSDVKDIEVKILIFLGSKDCEILLALKPRVHTCL